MAKLNTVSDEAKIALYHQQGALIDVIDSMLTESGWLDYFNSVVPEFNPYQTEPLTQNNAALYLMEVFRDSIFLGVTPPAVILIRIAEFFDRYLKDSGTLSLDEAFKLKGKNKIGHPLKVQQRTQRDTAIFLGISILRKLKTLSIEAAVGELINAWDIDANEEVLERNYRKFKKDSGTNLEWADELTHDYKDSLEKMLAHLFTIYTSGIPKPKMQIDRAVGKQHLKEHLVLCLKEMGVNLD